MTETPAEDNNRTLAIKCAKCGLVMQCDESILTIQSECPTCGLKIDPLLYEPLRKLIEERETAEQEAKRAEKEQLRRLKQEEQHARAVEKETAERQAAMRRREERAWRARQASDERERQRATAAQVQELTVADLLSEVPEQPTYGVLKLMASSAAAAGILSIAVAAILLIAAMVLRTPLLAIASPALLLAGIVILAYSELLRAIRNMAINSWKQVVLLQHQCSTPPGDARHQ